MLAASVVESFLWLHLGTEIGAFPGTASRDIYQSYLRPFFRSLLSTDAKAREEMEMDRLYVAHSEISDAMRPMLGRFAFVLLEKAMRQEEIFSSEQAKFSRPERLKAVFQTFLILYSQLTSRRSVELFTYQVNFADAPTWRQNWNKPCTAKEVERADIEHSSISSSICAGYLNLWNYAVKLMMTEQNLRGNAELAADLFRLTDRLKEMGRWRINLKHLSSSERFDDVRVRIMEKLDEDAKDDLSRICVKEIRTSMDNAFSFWFSAAPTPVPQYA